MSTIRTMSASCSVCGKTRPYRVLTSTNAFGSPDLDLRPPQMKRRTMPFWVHECPHCGYVAKNVSDPTQIPREYLKSNAYLNCGGIDFTEPLACCFYRQHLILLWDQKHIEAFFAILHAAWVCDDADDTENAVRCRSIAAELMEMYILPAEHKDKYLLLYADVLRRAGEFEKVANRLSDARLESEDLNRILAFELALTEKGDSGCYTVEDANAFFDQLCQCDDESPSNQ